MMKRALWITTLLGSLTSVAVAQPVEPTLAVAKAEPVHSINVSPLGLVAGDFGASLAVNYERLFDGHHGLIVEGVGSQASSGDGTSLQFGGGVGYRWHWRGRQNSGFLGVMLAQTFGNGEVRLDEMTYAMSVRSTTVTANIGKRWMIGPANITFRFGLGWGHHVADVKGDAPEAVEAEELMNEILAFLPFGIDGELSVGYTF